MKPEFTKQEAKSSSISSIGYCDKTATMLVTFKHGGEYHYHGVKKEQYEAFAGAKSIGKHFHSKS